MAVSRPLQVIPPSFLFAALLAAAPNITGVYNAAAWAPPGLPNSGVAQGALFTLTGTGLGPQTLQEVTAYPLPTTAGLAGVTIQVTVGGVVENCPMVYVWTTQVAALLPSATPTGTGTVTLMYQGASATASITVQAANFGAFTLNSAGIGPAVVTDANYNPITMINPAQPGETLILWGTGLGPTTGNETEPPPEVNLNSGVQVFVEGQPATVTYGGRSSSPGLDQINFVVPSGITGGCKTSIAVLVNSVTGNVTTTSIAPAGQSTCSDTFGALTAANLQKATANGSLAVGFITATRIAGGDDTLVAGFGSFTLNNLIRSFGGSIAPSVGSCIAYETSGTVLEPPADPTPSTLLATGALTLTGPGGAKNITASGIGTYVDTLAAAPNTYIQPGSYTVSNATNAANVGPFDTSLTLPAYVTPTNIPATVNRSQSLTLSWSGGSAYNLVSVFGYSGVPVNLPTSSFVQFNCSANASAGSFTIPSEILNLLPTDGYGTLTQKGVELQIAGVPLDNFTASGSPGLDSGIFTVYVSSGGVAAVQ
jgi:uncharacterized protein (TIGR03437 family)